MDGRVKRSTGRGVGQGRGTAGGGGEATGALLVGEGVANGDKEPRTLALIDPDKMEAMLDDKLPQWDVLMSKELEPPP